MWGSDQAASVEIVGLVRLVRDVRTIEDAVGDGVKRVYSSELGALKRLRRVPDGTSWAPPLPRDAARTLDPRGRRASRWTGFVMVERLVPYNRDQRVVRTGFWTDLVLYTVVQSYVMGIIIGRLILFMDGHTRFSRLGLVSHWSIAAQLGFFLVTHDLYIYTFHRLPTPDPGRFGVLHEAHRHSGAPGVTWLSEFPLARGRDPDQSDDRVRAHRVSWRDPGRGRLEGHGERDLGHVHPLESGRPARTAAVRLQRARRCTAGTTPMTRRVYNKNFATKLAIWDWLFGTAYFPDRKVQKAEVYGLPYIVYPEYFPLGYFVQLALAFRRNIETGTEPGPEEIVAPPARQSLPLPEPQEIVTAIRN